LPHAANSAPTRRVSLSSVLADRLCPITCRIICAARCRGSPGKKCFACPSSCRSLPRESPNLLLTLFTANRASQKLTWARLGPDVGPLAGWRAE
jgi:hypothetical protein